MASGKSREITFSDGSMEKKLDLNDGSVYVMSRFSQDHWRHGIAPLDTQAHVANDQSDSTNKNGKSDGSTIDSTPDGEEEIRYSFTFRHIAPFFNNSTIIVGDSNTKYIKFGTDIGTLGKWTPGKRVKAAKIDDIPAPEDIGPYQNIVISTGINDLTDEKRRSFNSLIAALKRKCDKIHSSYPKSRLYINLLLPTKSRLINNRVSEFNNLILDMSFSRPNMFVIDNSLLASEDGCLLQKFGRYIGNDRPNTNDIVHLGRNGIRIFCMNIKRSIMRGGRNQSVERFRGGGGKYRDAARRQGGDYHRGASRGRSSGISSR